jgi:glucose-1-phosphate thymidylyltransferase
MAEEFVEGDTVCAILGDNVYFDDLTATIAAFRSGGHVFLKDVPDAERFGVAELDRSCRVLGIEEKPLRPKSSLAVTGCYLYDSRCFDVIRNLKSSARGELEITDVSNWYAAQGELAATVLQDEWVDAGTFESLHRAAILVRERKLAAVAASTRPRTEKRLQKVRKS